VTMSYSMHSAFVPHTTLQPAPYNVSYPSGSFPFVPHSIYQPNGTPPPLYPAGGNAVMFPSSSSVGYISGYSLPTLSPINPNVYFTAPADATTTTTTTTTTSSAYCPPPPPKQIIYKDSPPSPYRPFVRNAYRRGCLNATPLYS
jgi:hypothetical protein